MRKRVSRSAAIAALLLLFCLPSFAQSSESKTKKTFRAAGKISGFLIKTTAKAAFETAKFAGKHIIVPAVRDVGVPIAKAAPTLAKNAVKLTAKGIKKGFEVLTDGDDHEGRYTGDQPGTPKQPGAGN
jgi:hypothetical protein